jgi:hypothetical protein
MEMTDFYEPSDDVIVSRFEDGTEITADFKKEELLLNGKRIARPEGLLEQ